MLHAEKGVPLIWWQLHILLLWTARLKWLINIKWHSFTERSVFCNWHTRTWTSTKCNGKRGVSSKFFSGDLSLTFWVLLYLFSFLIPLFSTSKDWGHPLTGRSHHSRGGHVRVTRHEGVSTGTKGVAWGPGFLGRSCTIRRRHGSSGSRGREWWVSSRVGGLGGCCSPCKSPHSFTVVTFIFAFFFSGKGFHVLFVALPCFTVRVSLLLWLIQSSKSLDYQEKLFLERHISVDYNSSCCDEM